MNHFARCSLAAIVLFAAGRMPSMNAQPPSTPQAKAQPAKARAATEPGGGGDVERGRYLVEGVAMCWRCHSPDGDMGHVDRAHWLLGAPIRSPEPDWAVYAPRLAGRPPGTDDQVITLLTTGISRTGKPPRLPMPRFRMNRQDADAILGYLKSLTR